MSSYSPVGSGDGDPRKQHQSPPQQQSFPPPPPTGFAPTQPYGAASASPGFTPSSGYQSYHAPPPPPSSAGGQQYYIPQSYYQQAPPQQPIAPSTPSFAPTTNYAAVNFASSSSDTTLEDRPGGGGGGGGLEGRLRRVVTKMVKKEIALSSDGNFVIDVPVAQSLMKDLPYTQGEEFTHLRYTACTSTPNDFPEKYTLRAKQYGRKIRIAVVVTMYNEDDVLFGKSFTAIMKNIAYICSGRCAGWTKDDWKDIVVCIVSDGRAKVNPLTLNVLSVMGCYMDGLAKASVNGHNVTAHVFEFTNQISVRRDLSIRRPGDKAKDGLTLVPCQTIFLLKEKNAKKINSHRWFFNAVCESLDPEVCVLIDCGTKPTKESFWHLYKAFDRNPNVAGACGEIAAELGKMWINLVNPIVAVQNFEYKMSNILDKPLESIFGYISVLPGAFSAYRYQALQGKPLECYFHGENPQAGNRPNVSEANMYLAEDRILCFELVMKENAQYVLKYVKSARAETDVPTDFSDLIKQRRRWLNGSFFASVHACMNWMRIWKSGHTSSRKWILTIEMLYNFINLAFSWFNIGNFFLAFYFIFNIAGSSTEAACNLGQQDNPDEPFYPHGDVVFGVVKTFYAGALTAIVIASMGNRPEAAKILYGSIAIIFAIIMFMMVLMSAYTIKASITLYNSTPKEAGIAGFFDYVKNTQSFRDMVIATGSTYGLYLFGSILHLDPWHVFTCMIQYFLMLPSFVNILTVYSFTNLHDVSWGTKGIDAASDLKAVVATTNAKGEKVVTVDLPADDKDSDLVWEEHKKQLMKEAAGLKERKDDGGSSTTNDDYFKQFRTNTVLLWFFSNGLLVYIFTNAAVVRAMFPNSTAANINPYLTFLFWSVAFLSFIRFLCSTIYLIGWWSEGLSDAGKRNPIQSITGSKV
ncbi:chitin synthase-domain-containing protein [Zopfochytrium polystomum]|nr:chitin synthase-domain-containing protein [Zopfochytrium polystomum]